ncbi:MAG TPA: molybdate ABC transporter substrate-binding protein [Rhizomicrobium sp.]|jgi:molybdate transport system substrate-binding protein|nr:molybdate ABC transporter substrate-binding protein [Rhizomicrobium sp.]
MPKLAAIFVAIVSLMSAPAAVAAGKITVFAAASLTNALRAADAAYTKRTGIAVLESFASSSTLARQIEAGAPAAVFISADTKWMDYLAGKGLIATQTPLLGNGLALIAPADAPVSARGINAGFNWLKLLGPDGRLAVGDPDHVPAGIYAKEALQHLGVWNELEPRLARAEDVRGALALVERGDAPLGIVYVTDARVSAKVKIVGVFPPASHSPIVYPAAIVKGNDLPPVRNYFRFLQGAQARADFVRFGFAKP